MANLLGDIFEEIGPALQRTGLQIGAKQERDQARKANILLDALSRLESGRRFEMTFAQNQARLKQDRELADRIFKFNVGQKEIARHETARKTLRESEATERKRLTGIETKKAEKIFGASIDTIKSFVGQKFKGPSFSDYGRIIAEKPVNSPLSDAEYFQQKVQDFSELGGSDMETLLEALSLIQRQAGGQGKTAGKKAKIPTIQEIEAMTPEERSALLESFSRQ